MGFQKGHTFSKGRPKGTPNKATEQMKIAMATLLQSNTDNMNKWLQEVAKESPREALKLMLSMAEYFVPKLSRTEIATKEKDSLYEGFQIRIIDTNDNQKNMLNDL